MLVWHVVTIIMLLIETVCNVQLVTHRRRCHFLFSFLLRVLKHSVVLLIELRKLNQSRNDLIVPQPIGPSDKTVHAGVFVMYVQYTVLRLTFNPYRHTHPSILITIQMELIVRNQNESEFD